MGYSRRESVAKKGKESKAQEIIISRRQIVEYNQNRVEILVIQLSKMRQSSYTTEQHQPIMLQSRKKLRAGQISCYFAVHNFLPDDPVNKQDRPYTCV